MHLKFLSSREEEGAALEAVIACGRAGSDGVAAWY